VAPTTPPTPERVANPTVVGVATPSAPVTVETIAEVVTAEGVAPAPALAPAPAPVPVAVTSVVAPA